MMEQTDETIVWVKTSVLNEAVQLEEKEHAYRNSLGKRKNEKEQHYGWTLAQVVGGYDVLTDNRFEENGGAQVKVHVQKRSSVYSGRTIAVPVELFHDADEDVFLMANADIDSEEGESKELPPDDLITLTHLHEPSVVNCLRRRYENDIIYTSTGANLLAINPFKELPSLYGEEAIKQYWLAGEAETRMIPLKDVSDEEDADSLPPHVYAVADRAFQSMLSAIDGSSGDLKTNQAVVVTGESGAGKTVSTKHAMEYIAKVCQLRSREKKLEELGLAGRPLTSTILKKSALRVSRNASMARAVNTELRVIQSNPILEAFGNARTMRNDNSSRFGKFVELHFKESGSLLGAHIETYLLEKVRLVHQSSGERTFHIFYEFLASATEEERKQYLLDELDARDFKMTSKSGTYERRDGVDDYAMFDSLLDSLGLIGIDDADQKGMLRLISAFLHSSNLTFLSIANDEESKVEEENEHLDPVLKLLGLDYEPFNIALTSFSIHVRDKEYVRKLTKAKAEKGLQALMKATYEALFKHIVQTINENLIPGEEKAASISLLDISGFECFEENSFEQLCINYCNEMLHQQFTMLVFKAEFHEYEKEGIEFSDVTFQDNQEVLELIDKKGQGIIAILHDQCKVPGTSDRTFATNMYQHFQTHPRFRANRRQKAEQKFSIIHYAGPVEYTIEGFVEKNKDEVPREGSELLLSSSNAFVRKMAEIIMEGHKPKLGGSGKHAQNRGISHQLTTQLRTIRRKIDDTSPHYIRCFKPNPDLLPNKFQSTLVANQLQYAGVLEALRVSRLWFAHRYVHSAFHNRYFCLAMKELHAFDGSKDEMYKLLVEVVARQVWKITRESSDKLKDRDNDPLATGSFVQRVHSSDDFSFEVVGLQLGKTKVFLRQQTFNIIEFIRGKRIRDTVVVIQANARGFLALRKYRDTIHYVHIVQKYCRRLIAKLIVVRRRKEIPAALKIQSMWRAKAGRSRYKSIISLAVWVQAHFRGWKGREQYRLLEEERKIEVEAKVCDVDGGEDELDLQKNDAGTQDDSNLIGKESNGMGGNDETEADVDDIDKKEENSASGVDGVGKAGSIKEATDQGNETDASKVQSSSGLQEDNVKVTGEEVDTNPENSEAHKAAGKSEGGNEAAGESEGGDKAAGKSEVNNTASPQAVKTSTAADATEQGCCCVIS